MLTSTASSKVTAAHLSRQALLYVRQSSLKQVLHNTESAIRQYDLRGKAVALGWASDQITVIDIDQGQSGASAADREGFQQLVAEVSLGRAGIVLGLECSRLARNSADWHQLLELCGMTGTLICDEDGLYDPRNFNDRLLLGMKGQMSEAELHFIRARLRGGIVSKARRGELITPLPVGLAYDAAGHRHPRPRHRRPQSHRAPVRHLRRDRLSHRVRESVQRRGPVLSLGGTGPDPVKGEIDWKPLAHHVVLRILHNPRWQIWFASAGTTTSSCPAGSCSRTAPRGMDLFPPRRAPRIHHPGAIRRQPRPPRRQRRRARPGPGCRAAREGPALLQGIIICGTCGGTADDRPLHQRRGRELPAYVCQRDGIEHGHRSARPSPVADSTSGSGSCSSTPSPRWPSRPRLRMPPQLQHRAAEADALHAAHVQARPLPRRPGPPLPRRQPRQPARRRHPRSRLEHRAPRPGPSPGRLRAGPQTRHRTAHQRPENPDQPAGHRPAGHLERPRRPPARERKRIARLLLTDVTVAQNQRHHHRAPPPARRARPHPAPSGTSNSLGTPPTSPRPSRQSINYPAATPTPRSPTSSTPAAWSAARDAPSTT